MRNHGLRFGLLSYLMVCTAPLFCQPNAWNQEDETEVPAADKHVSANYPARSRIGDNAPSALRGLLLPGPFERSDKQTVEAIPPGLHALGLLPTADEQTPAASDVLQELIARQHVSSYAALALPSLVDNSSGLPPTGDQGAQNSCASWTVGYYMKSYQEAQEHGWGLGTADHQFSPRFIYNQIQGFDEGSTFPDNFDVLMDQGCATLTDEPYVDTDYLTYPTAQSYRNAIPYRGQSYEYLGHGETYQIFPAVKALLAAGEVVAVGIPIYREGLGLPGRFDLLGPGDNEYDLPTDDPFLAGLHAVVIVGYDESKFGGDGGYKIVNQWGSAWGDSGFAWLSERFLNTFGLEFYRMTDRIGYQPTGMLHYKVQHSYWWYDNVTVTVGVGPVAAPWWSKPLNKRLLKDGLTWDRWADISDAADYLPAADDNRWWMKISDGAREDSALLTIAEIDHLGTLESAELVLPQQGTFYSGTMVVDIPPGEAASSAYYVNDAYDPAKDVYCSAAGNDANDGLSPSTPKGTLQAIIDQYTLRGGDTVYVDNGTYAPGVAVSIGNMDRGLEGNPIRVLGAIAPSGEPATAFQGATNSSIVSFYGNRFFAFENIQFHGGARGIYYNGEWDYWVDGLDLKNCVLHGQTGYPCEFYEAKGMTLERCRISGFGGSRGIDVGRSSATTIQSSIAAPTGQSCAYVWSSSSYYASGASLGLGQSILTATGTGGVCASSDSSSSLTATYCDFYAANGAAIGFTPDATNLQVDPLFANPDTGDLHLQSTAGRWDPLANSGTGGWVTDAVDSPCIDAGPLDAEFGLEPEPNGGRLNIGAYGGTAFASKSALANRYLLLDSPTTGGKYHGECPIQWRALGQGWQAGDTLLAEYSSDNGTSWNPVLGASALAYDSGVFSWDISALTPGYYLFRLTCNQAPAITVQTAATFYLTAYYYVNDTFNAATDVYCTAAGNDANDGKTPDTPKATIAAIPTAYDLEPGDVVLIDAGTYVLAADVSIGDQDAGATWRGALGATLLQRTGSGAAFAVSAVGAKNTIIEKLIFTGGTSGISKTGTGYVPFTIRNNVFANQTGQGVYMYRGSATLTNNTFYEPNASGYYGGSSNSFLYNNVFHVGGSGRACISLADVWAPPTSYQNSFDFNHYYPHDGASVAFLGGVTGQDGHSTSGDPRFVEIGSNDFHVQSTGGSWHGGAWTVDATDSPCIDAADPAMAFASEPTPNGGRLNQGAFGGTAQASKTSTGRALHLDAPTGGEIWKGTQKITWHVNGSGWQAGDTLLLEYSTDSGGTWTAFTGAAAIPYGNGAWLWNTTSFSDGLNYRVRITCNQAPGVQSGSLSDFTVHNVGLNYYVNDAYNAATDVYCTAAGNDANNGRSPSTPKATLTAILSAYDLEPGDVVYVDAGTYTLTADVTIGDQDGGATWRGVPGATVLQRGGSGNCISLTSGGATNTIIDSLTFLGGTNGISKGAYGYVPLTIRNCVFSGQTGQGVYIYRGSTTLINNTFYEPNAHGYYAGSSASLLNNNVFHVGGTGKACIFLADVWAPPTSYQNDFDYNHYFTHDGASRGILGGVVGQDTHSTSGDPLFVNAGANDFHLQSTAGSFHDGAWTADAADSPCIDAGDPVAAYAIEPSPNGGRINQGAFGGTSQASKTSSDRVLHLDAPQGGEIWRGTQHITWHVNGAGWQPNDTVLIEYSQDSGSTWTAYSGGSGVPYEDGSWEWDTTAFSDGLNYRVRLTCEQAPAVQSASLSDFAIHNIGLDYYVNDGFNASTDIYCTASGDDLNDGKSPATPKATLAAILSVYDLEPGDVVHVDAGLYVLGADVIIGDQDGGATWQGVPGTSVLQRTGSGSGFYLSPAGATNTFIDGLSFFGGTEGVTTSNDGGGTLTLRNNVFAGQTSYGIRIFGQSSHNAYQGHAKLFNNTFYEPNANGYYAGSSNSTLYNNIFHVGGAGRACVYLTFYWANPSNYTNLLNFNDYFPHDGASFGFMTSHRTTLAEWQAVFDQDAQSTDVDPVFVDFDGPDNTPGNTDDDFHLQSTAESWHGGAWTADAADSPCIDAGDWAMEVGSEPVPNGAIINMGAYGGTTQASKSPRILNLLAPNGGERYREVALIRWYVNPLLWPGGGTVTLEYSDDGGTTWYPVSGGVSLPGTDTEFLWDISGLDDGSDYLVRVTADHDANISDTSFGLFSIGGAYYVNDGEATGDVFCTALGAPGNNGQTPATPLDSLQSLIGLYTLGPDDVVYVDSGTYVLTADIVIGDPDSGSSGKPLRIQGVPSRTILNRNGAGTGISLQGNYIELAGLDIRNAATGVYFSDYATGCRITGCRFSANSSRAICLEDCSGHTIDHNVITHAGASEAVLVVNYSYGDYNRCNVLFSNNVVVTSNRLALYVGAHGGPIVKNNILVADGVGGRCIGAESYYYWSAIDYCDYNLLYPTNGATLGTFYGIPAANFATWQSLTGWDLHSQSADPLFADPLNGDYHLKSKRGRWDPAANGGAGGFVVDTLNSPCIDAGDPADDVGDETSPNGGIINQGAYGGTIEASQSLPRMLVFHTPGRDAELHAWELLRWEARGTGWASSFTVRLEYSTDGGATWNTIPGAETLPYDAGSFWFDTSSVPDGASYLFRVVWNEGSGVRDATDSPVAIHNLQAPWGPTPINTATNQSIATHTLDWREANGATSYSLHFWGGGLDFTVTDLVETTYELGELLQYDTTYHWQVTANSASTTTLGGDWTFSTPVSPTDVYVDANGGSDTVAEGTTALPFQTIGKALALVHGSSSHPITMHIAEGVYPEQVAAQSYEHLYGGYHATNWTRNIDGYPTTVDGENVRRGIVLASNVTIDGITFQNGYSAGNGGGAYGSSVGNVLVRSCKFIDCSAASGGGLYAYSGYSGLYAIENCFFSGCAASYQGGGLFITYPVTGSRITRCIVSSCSAQSEGGGIVAVSGPLTIESSLLTENSSPLGTLFSNSAVVRNCTLYGNQSGIWYVLPTAGSIENCIIWANGDDLNGVTQDKVFNCNIEDGDFLGVNGNISTDPMFYDALAGDIHLHSDSPCIDAGDDTRSSAADFDGELRPFGAHVDIGADEYVDIDGDQMPDTWENQNGFNPFNPADGTSDSDNDSLNNASEYWHRADPDDWDSDDDGFGDGAEVLRGFSPTDPDAHPTPVWVDFNYSGVENGTQAQPYNTVAEGVSAAPSLGYVYVKSGQNSQGIRITKALRFEAKGGLARIGASSSLNFITIATPAVTPHSLLVEDLLELFGQLLPMQPVVKW